MQCSSATEITYIWRITSSTSYLYAEYSKFQLLKKDDIKLILHF